MKANSNSSRHRSTDMYNVLSRDIATLRKDVASLLGQGLGEVTGRTRELMHETSEKAKAVHERVGEFAGSRPLTTIVIAALAGAVGVKALAWMFRR